MTASVFGYPIIDVDSHIIEPPDLWTSRLAKKWGSDVPHIETHPMTGEEMWAIGNDLLSPVAFFAIVGSQYVFPEYPRGLAEADPAVHDPVARLAKLDENGIYAQVLYPNLIGQFFADKFADLDPKLALECVRAYNDYLTEFCSADPARLIPLTVLPFWDIQASIRELERCAAMGHRGMLFAHTFANVGLPNIPDPHWAPLLDAAQSLGQSVNFHIGFASAAEQDWSEYRHTPRRTIAAEGVLNFMSNARAINMLTIDGVCHRYPDLKFVCVESGFGFVPMQLQTMDWQWVNNGASEVEPDALLPSEYFRRQVFVTFWFERPSPEQLENLRDNVMWETDYPHPSAQWPTPRVDIAKNARDAIEYSFAGVSEGTRRQVLYENAAKLYRVGSV